MKCLQIILPLLGLFYCMNSASGDFQERIIRQRLLPIDQFETRTWENRYYIDDSSYTPGGPMFLTTGASMTALSYGWLDHTYFFDIGREMNALLVHTEHRFYDENRPTPDVSMANLQFLDSRYAVDDVANLVTHLREEYETGPVIAHGFDHGAAISVWLAHRHPHLVDGLWASSATIAAEKDFSRFLTIIAEDIRTIGGDECYRYTEEAFQQMEHLYATGNYAELESTFNLCSRFIGNDEPEVFAFFYSHAIALGNIIRYNHRAGVEAMCLFYQDHEHEPMVGMAEFLRFILPYCVDIDPYQGLIDFQNTTWDSYVHVSGFRQLVYQNCREFGWYVSSSSPDHPFGNRFPLELFQQQCAQTFGPIFSTSNMITFYNQLNQIFGGNRPNITNAYFTVGEFDPTRDLGVLESYRDSIYVDIIPNFGAGAEVLSAGIHPAPEIEAVQARARELISLWVGAATRK